MGGKTSISTIVWCIRFQWYQEVNEEKGVAKGLGWILVEDLFIYQNYN